MHDKIELLDVVTLMEDLPEHGLYRGQVGTVIEVYTPEDFEVEFSDTKGQTYAMLALNANQLMLLHHELVLKP